jgi:hypothetical protein
MGKQNVAVVGHGEFDVEDRRQRGSRGWVRHSRGSVLKSWLFAAISRLQSSGQQRMLNCLGWIRP